MRRCLLAIALALIAAAPAEAVITNPDATYAAWQNAPTELTIQGEDGSTRTVALPDACYSGAAAGRTRIALVCRGDLLVIDPATGAEQTAAPDLGWFGLPPDRVVGIGSRWALLAADPEVHAHWAGLWNRTSGATIRFRHAPPFGPGRLIDLDAAGGYRPLCPGAPGFRWSAGVAPTRDGRRVLYPHKSRPWTLFDCRTRKTREVDGEPVMNARYLVTRLQPDRLRVEILATGRQRSVPIVPGADFALSRDGLWITAPGGAPSYLPLAAERLAHQAGADADERRTAGAHLRHSL